MSTRDVHDRRPFVVLTVLFWHAALVWLLVWTDRQPFARAHSSSGLVLMPLPKSISSTSRAALPSVDLRSTFALTLPNPRSLQSAPADVTAMQSRPAEPPPIVDWASERETAAKSKLQDIEKQSSYRDLGSLSPQQLDWVRQNHYEPAPSNIPWKAPRVEVSAGGFPIIHINDHCIAIPLMMMMVFCSIGHIEPDGTLFEHMRDPHEP